MSIRQPPPGVWPDGGPHEAGHHVPQAGERQEHRAETCGQQPGFHHGSLLPLLPTATQGSADTLAARELDEAQRRHYLEVIVRNAQRTIQARCKVCHDFQHNGKAVKPPTKSNRWFKGERTFDHGKHLNESVKTKCIDCHEGVVESKKTSDVNMPGVKNCVGCHKASSEYKDKGIQTCQTCHPYHSLTARAS